jgi:hypothetical protein
MKYGPLKWKPRWQEIYERIFNFNVGWESAKSHNSERSLFTFERVSRDEDIGNMYSSVVRWDLNSHYF